jgi:nitrate reductase alpha subunit
MPGNRKPMLQTHEFFRQGPASAEGWSQLVSKGRDWESFYRNRWQHDKIVRSTHGVNCTGSCSWWIYVKDGIITWENQAVDYPSLGADSPEYEPRGCPRGASYSWYIYSPLRVKYPYVRGSLLEMWKEAKTRYPDPVEAWATIVEDPVKSRTYKLQRGKGGLVRSTWDEVTELIAAAHVYTIKRYGPDRVVGFSPIPAMSMVSYSAGTRYLSLIGGTILSFYDWYADLPPASPQVWGDQTDVPESGDWWNAAYLIIWGTNLPITRTPDAHFMTEARYKGQKVVVVSPDYSDHTKFADTWLAAHPGTDGALAMAMGHVILKEFYVERQVSYFQEYGRQYTDLPFLVSLREHGDSYVPDRFLRASDLGDVGENAEWKTVVLDEATGEPAVPNGSIGYRYGESGMGKWNLKLGDIHPVLSLYGRHGPRVTVDLPRFDTEPTGGDRTVRRGVPTLQVGDRLVTTVYDLTLAQYGVAREGLPGDWPAGYDDPQPYTPAWQAEITSVDGRLAAKVAREFARNAELTGGRSMICMGAGTNHWFHSDQIYRAFLSLVMLCGCEGVNGGGWAHYVGQEKVRPLTGWQTVAFALDWIRPPRHQAGTPFWYLATDQWRYDSTSPDQFTSPLGRGLFRGKTMADCNALAARLGWLPSFPSFNRSSLDLADEAESAGMEVVDYVVQELQAGNLRFAADDPDAPENFPRVLTIWRGNVMGSSGKGHEYFRKHLLGAENPVVRNEELPPEARPADVVWRDEAPEGKVDLLLTMDFRMTGTCVFSDIVLPAATWYEKQDLSSTDMHPFINSFNQAITPPWEAKADWEIFKRIATAFSELAAKHLGVRKDVIAAPLNHDSPDELAQPWGAARDWKRGECEPHPGKTMPKLITVERDYGAVAEKMTAIGPLLETAGSAIKSASWKPIDEVKDLSRRNGKVTGGVADGRPALVTAQHVCETILSLSATTNGHLAVEGFKSLEPRAGVELASLAEARRGDAITYLDTQTQPRLAMTSPEWSGIEAHGRRYAPFTINVERKKPWHTLSGRQHFFLDHEWMQEYGEALPIFRPPLNPARAWPRGNGEKLEGAEVTVRYLTPHSKWSIHSEYQENLYMQTLFRGGPVIWMNKDDAAAIGVQDNDWIEAHNRNGIVVCRAVVTHRLPPGVCFMYHAQDRHLNVPISRISGRRGGTNNSLTRITMKPTHMIGGYAQLSYAFNYYGPTGSQRDEVTTIRKHSGPVEYG